MPAARAPDVAAEEPGRERGPVGQICPACGQGRILAGRAAWGCSRWKEGCRWRLAFPSVQG